MGFTESTISIQMQLRLKMMNVVALKNFLWEGLGMHYPQHICISVLTNVVVRDSWLLNNIFLPF